MFFESVMSHLGATPDEIVNFALVCGHLDATGELAQEPNVLKLRSDARKLISMALQLGPELVCRTENHCGRCLGCTEWTGRKRLLQSLQRKLLYGVQDDYRGLQIVRKHDDG